MGDARLLCVFGTTLLAAMHSGLVQAQEPPPRYVAVLIEKDARGRLPSQEATQLQEVYERMGGTSVSVWVAARVTFNPDIPPESARGIAQQRRVDSAVAAILARLEHRAEVDTRYAERPTIGPYVAVPLMRQGIEELVADRLVEAFYVLLPEES